MAKSWQEYIPKEPEKDTMKEEMKEDTIEERAKVLFINLEEEA